ncbi:hypothetical protein ACIBW9_37195 [Streptomyces sp. NPDC049541]|uniref:hypothetical protein n=1 Tax=Streptomyces sp. NPDC049541 TaxID=3365594 RepID=UPI0037BB70F7
MFEARDPSVALSPLRELLREDAAWGTILHDITERATASVEEISDFEASFTDTRSANTSPMSAPCPDSPAARRGQRAGSPGGPPGQAQARSINNCQGSARSSSAARQATGRE